MTRALRLVAWELRLLLRSSGYRVLLAAYAALLVVGIAGSLRAVGRARAEADLARNARDTERGTLVEQLRQKEAGAARVDDPWSDPAKPGRWVDGGAQVITRAPGALSVLAQGVPAGWRPAVTVGVMRFSQAFDAEPLEAPRLQLAGAVDLGLVLVWLLPLVLIAATFDAVAREMENGVEPLLRALGEPVQHRLLRTLLARVAPVLALTGVAEVVAVGIAGPTVPVGLVLLVLVATAAYVALWTALAACVVASREGSSGAALRLLAAWAFVAVALPFLVGAVAGWVAPPPSQTELIVARRTAAVPVRSAGSRLLQRYYEDHPELAASQPDRTDFYKKYILVEDQVEAVTAPLVAVARERFRERRQVARRLAWASPSLLFAECLQDLSGEGPGAAAALESAAKELYEAQRAFLLPRLFSDRPISVADLRGWPAAPRLSPQPTPAAAVAMLLGLVGWTMLLAVAGRRLLAAPPAQAPSPGGEAVLAP